MTPEDAKQRARELWLNKLMPISGISPAAEDAIDVIALAIQAAATDGARALRDALVAARQVIDPVLWPKAAATIDAALSSISAEPPAGQWRPIETAQKNKTPVLLLLKNPIPDSHTDLRRFDGLQFVGSHVGLADDGFDIGWNFAAPVEMGSFPDEWIAGWQPLPEPPR